MARKRSPAALAKKNQMDAVGGPLGLREKTLADAGYTEEQLATMTKLALDTAVADMLGATVTQRLVVGTGRGVSEVQEFTDPDFRARNAARALIVDVVGVKASKSMAAVKVTGPTNIQINFDDRESQRQRAQQQAQAKVIEVKARPA